VRVAFWTKSTDLESIRLNKWNSWITCYDVQSWHADVFKLLALNAGSLSSSYWNSPVNGKWGSQTNFKEEETTILVQWWMWSLLTSSIFARWNCWTTEQIIPVRFTELTSHHWTDFPSSWFPFQVHKDFISMSQRSVWTARTLGLSTVCLVSPLPILQWFAETLKFSQENKWDRSLNWICS